MWYVFCTLDAYEVIDKAQLVAALLLGGMGNLRNAWALVWSNIPSPLSLRHQAVPHVARCLCFFRRAGFSICFSTVTGTMGCSNTAPAKSPQDLSAAPCSCAWAAANRAWQLWVSEGLQGSCRPLLHCHTFLEACPRSSDGPGPVWCQERCAGGPAALSQHQGLSLYE